MQTVILLISGRTAYMIKIIFLLNFILVHFYDKIEVFILRFIFQLFHIYFPSLNSRLCLLCITTALNIYYLL